MFLDLDQLAKISNMRLYCQTSSYTDSCSIEKGYKCIDHAYTALKQNDELYFADAISNLRKAINYRVSDLFSNLGVDNLSLPLGKYRRFEKLELLGIVKPLLLHKLLIVRNGIEYNFETPPCKAECEELADVVWYFYKSTDRLCSNRPYSWLMEWQEDGFECFIDFEIDFESSLEIAKRSRGTPRVANRLFRRVRDFAQYINEDEKIDLEVTKLSLKKLNIDEYGLNDTDRKYLKAIIERFKGGPVGLNALAASISEEANTLEDVYEPYLLQEGFVVRTPRGRMVTEKGYKHLGIEKE